MEQSQNVLSLAIEQRSLPENLIEKQEIIIKKLNQNIEEQQLINFECERDLAKMQEWVKDRVKILKMTKDNFDVIYKAIRKLKRLKEMQDPSLSVMVDSKSNPYLD